MKLANALAERADLQTRISQLQSRLISNALVQEGEQPAEDPNELLRELEEDFRRLEWLISRINRTNAAVKVESEETISDLLARRDCLTSRVGALRNFLTAASAQVRRGTVGEIKIKSTVNVRELQKQADALSKELRELDTAIQEKNWTTELME